MQLNSSAKHSSNRFWCSKLSLQIVLIYLLSEEYQNKSCSDVLLQLRKGVFQSNFLKEIALFDSSYRIFCSSNSGDTSFVLYSSIIERLQESGQTPTDNLHMKVIVEGVEEKEQLAILNSLGFQYIQGFYYHKPMPKSELIKLCSTPA